ncbi:hypothetical protein FOL46_002539 [Perkinsus olseni]|nr:hypothetical protein FOL46_002539 [Perkinsus olseni]
MITDRLVSKIGRGTETIHDTTFLHTEPHHDDIMLGYLPSVIRQTRPTSNKHYFICATSGFNSVSNYHIRHMIARAEKFISTNSFAKLVGEGYFLPKPYDGDDDGLTSPAMTSSANFVDINTPPPPPAVTTTTTDPAREHYQLTRSRDVWQYLDGVAAKDENEKAEGSARRFIRNIIEIYGLSHSRDLHGQVEDKLHHLDDYLNTVYPGQADTRDVQILKGSCREFESECAWGSLGWLPSHVAHMRLGFYTSDIFTPDPTLERDSKPVIHVLLRTQPDIVTVAFDPEASGPDTHYKVLQAVTEALKVYQRTRPDKPIKVWGYRNVWYRFDTSEVTHIVPSSLSSLGSLDRMFMTNFESQTSAEFPSYELDGPFSKLAARIQVEQYKNLKVCLGRRWFQEHTSALIRATKGLVYFKEMTVPELEKVVILNNCVHLMADVTLSTAAVVGGGGADAPSLHKEDSLLAAAAAAVAPDTTIIHNIERDLHLALTAADFRELSLVVGASIMGSVVDKYNRLQHRQEEEEEEEGRAHHADDDTPATTKGPTCVDMSAQDAFRALSHLLTPRPMISGLDGEPRIFNNNNNNNNNQQQHREEHPLMDFDVVHRITADPTTAAEDSQQITQKCLQLVASHKDMLNTAPIPGSTSQHIINNRLPDPLDQTADYYDVDDADAAGSYSSKRSKRSKKSRSSSKKHKSSSKRHHHHHHRSESEMRNLIRTVSVLLDDDDYGSTAGATRLTDVEWRRQEESSTRNDDGGTVKDKKRKRKTTADKNKKKEKKRRKKDSKK